MALLCLMFPKRIFYTKSNISPRGVLRKRFPGRMVLAYLVILISNVQITAHAQQIRTEEKALKIGDKIPEHIWSMPINQIDRTGKRSTIKLADFKGKLLVLDFWGRGCTSCIAAMPNAVAMQQRFRDQLKVLYITRDKAADIVKCLYTTARIKDLDISTVFEDQTFQQLFPHQIITHYIWIAPDGHYLSQASSDVLTPANIQNAIQGGKAKWQEKEDVDRTLPLFITKQLPEGIAVQNYSIFLKGQISGLTGGSHTNTNDSSANQDRLYSNITIRRMYEFCLSEEFKARKLAVNRISKRMLIELEPDDPFLDSTTVYTFQYIQAKSNPQPFTQAIAQSLNQSSGYYGRIEVRKTPHYKLIRINNKNRIATQGAKQSIVDEAANLQLINCPVSILISRLSNRNDLFPFLLDETGYTDNIDIQLKGSLVDLPALRKELIAYGLDLQYVEEAAPMFIISKPLKPIDSLKTGTK